MKPFIKSLKIAAIGVVFTLALMISAAAAGVIAEGAGIVTADALNLRASTSTSSASLALVSKGTIVVILETADDDWYKVNYNGTEGYMASEYLTLSTVENFNATGEVTENGVRMRSGPGTDTSIVATYNNGTTMKITGINGGWYKVVCDGNTGYIRSDMMNVVKPSASATSTTGEKIVAFAKQYIGYRYVYGGASPGTGFDCSGFTSYVYKQFGYTSINRTAAGQYKNGTSVSKAELQAGDLVFFASGGSIYHVGIYIGNGQFIHASTSSVGVVISDLNSAHYTSRYYGAKRLVS